MVLVLLAARPVPARPVPALPGDTVLAAALESVQWVSFHGQVAVHRCVAEIQAHLVSQRIAEAACEEPGILVVD